MTPPPKVLPPNAITLWGPQHMNLKHSAHISDWILTDKDMGRGGRGCFHDTKGEGSHHCQYIPLSSRSFWVMAFSWLAVSVQLHQPPSLTALPLGLHLLIYQMQHLFLWIWFLLGFGTQQTTCSMLISLLCVWKFSFYLWLNKTAILKMWLILTKSEGESPLIEQIYINMFLMNKSLTLQKASGIF
jgi:hypothetical protein